MRKKYLEHQIFVPAADSVPCLSPSQFHAPTVDDLITYLVTVTKNSQIAQGTIQLHHLMFITLCIKLVAITKNGNIQDYLMKGYE